MRDADIQLTPFRRSTTDLHDKRKQKPRPPKGGRDLAQSAYRACDNVVVFESDGFLRDSKNYVSVLTVFYSSSYGAHTRPAFNDKNIRSPQIMGKRIFRFPPPH